MTVMQYMTQERLERAKRLLEETDFLIQDISRSVGYLDENYFVKVFRKRFRLSPSEYRKYRRAD